MLRRLAQSSKDNIKCLKYAQLTLTGDFVTFILEKLPPKYHNGF